ncbi:MAG TPA: serine hydrolase domain-containing protein [Rubrobacter sp.]|nr:serine hydrolase domain-containing protein [Rubrobacter sp.]
MNHPLTIKNVAMAVSMTIVLALVLLLSPGGSATGQEKGGAPHGNAPTAPQQQGPTDRAEMKAFMDKLMGREMKTHHIAGAAVSVVKDGKLFFAKGYGDADLKNGIPVDPERTTFRIGSVTKLFTWTAVMQLAEQGKLDLDEDINTYLDFRIPDTYPQPITLKDLMTHTAGFEDRYYERLEKDPNDLLPPREWLISHMPARVRPPGEVAAYSSYGTALAGYIVGRVSGEPYDRYIQEHILNPLDMAHTTAHSPTPQDIRAHSSVGYTYKDGAFKAFPDYTDMGQPAMAPAGGMQASATDMARFMIAQLRDGGHGDANTARARILNEGTLRRMHGTLYTPDPRLLGTAYGFFDFTDDGQRTIGHSGGSDPIYSLLLLLPTQNLGVFVVYNSQGGEDLTNQHLGFQRAFFDHYYPAPAVEPLKSPANFAERAGRFEGTYRITGGTPGTSYTTLEKVGVLLGMSTVKIGDAGEGTLLFTNPWGKWRFVETKPLYFRQVDGPFHILFGEDEQGRITRMFTDYTPMFAFEKLKWYETPGFNIALGLGCIMAFLSMIPVAAIRFIRSRRPSGERKPTPRGAQLAYGIVVGISVLNLLFVIGTVVWGNPVPLFGVSMIYKIVLGVGVLSAVLTVGALVYGVLAWRNGYWGVTGRLPYTLVTVAAVTFVWFLNIWNLLGWRF